MKIAFIGGGNMASALISGLSAADPAPEWIRVSEPSPEARSRLDEIPGVTSFDQALPAIEGAQVVVLAVKPQIMPLVLDEISNGITAGQLVISIAAGITIEQISSALANNPPVIRCMPNTPALIGKGITGLFASPDCLKEHRQLAERVLATTGATVWVAQESLINAVTAVSGSGPAYFFLLIEALRDAGTQIGLPAEIADQLALHTAAGAAAMAVNSDLDVAELRRRVTSPGGTTLAAINAFEAGGLRSLVAAAVNAANNRGEELAREAEKS